jgi:predicted DNA-binding transcriptional regulator YafY
VSLCEIKNQKEIIMARGDQLARQWKIFQTLVTSRHGKSVADLAKDFDCHKRTVYRDLEALEAAGFPLYTESVNGRNLWLLMDSARNPMPVPFSLPELMALYFGRDTLKVLKGTVFHDSLEDLFQKIEATLPPESKKYLKNVEKSLKVGSMPHKPNPKFDKIIDRIKEAVISKRVIDIVYYTMSRKKETRRKVEPYKLWFLDGTFYLIGHCKWIKGIRIFAVDRIKMLALTDEKFEVPDDFDIDDFMGSSFGAFQGQPEKVRILFSADIAGYIKEKIWHESQKLHDNPDGSVLFEADVACTKDFKAWIMRWGAGAIVLEPEELRSEIRAETLEMLAVYADGIEQVEKTLTA